MKELYKEGYTQNRELSWLKFDDRVLDEAMDESVPLLERLKFISIFTSNLDEFFMIRVGSLFDMMNVHKSRIDGRSGMTPEKQLQSIFEAVRPLYRKREQLFGEVEKQLRFHDIYQLEYKELESGEKKLVKRYYKESIEPVLSPQIVDIQHPFPHLVNKVIHIGVMLRYKKREIFGVVPIPDMLPEVFYLPGSGLRYIRTENIIRVFVQQLFEPYEVTEKVVFSVTRNGDVNPDDEIFAEEADFRKRIKKVLGQRRRLAPVRLELSNNISSYFIAYFMEKLHLEQQQIYVTSAPLKMGYVFKMISRIPEGIRKPLLYEPFEPVWPGYIRKNESLIQQVERGDILLAYPFESMEPFLQLIREAANDPAVISIKITIYRLASKAKLVEYLCAAAENGKSVTVLIELRARFDEQNNIDWSKRLEEAGCTIIYGFEFYKVHSKVCLITRKKRNNVQYITQVGTGNFNENTAKMYTDLALITADSRIGQDAAEFFKNMSIANLEGEYEHLLVAPVSLKSSVIDCIEEEMAKGRQGRIFIKVNSLTDVDIIEKLSQASCAGVKIRMVIRGISCLLPGIPGKTENIQISSIVGRYLEHSRIYCFGTGKEEKMYISSADFMTRNTVRRVEAACPIYDEKIRQKIHKIMRAVECDTVKARVLMSDGNYKKKNQGQVPVDSQARLMMLAESEQIGEKSEGKEKGRMEKWFERFKHVLKK